MTTLLCEWLLVVEAVHARKYSHDEHRRFLKARQFNLKQAKVMWKNCYDWRMNAEGVGIDELYRRIDPFDVSLIYLSTSYHFLTISLQYPERDHVFKFWPLFFHKVRRTTPACLTSLQR